MNGKEAYNDIPTKDDFEKNTEKAQGWVKALQLFKTLSEKHVFAPDAASKVNDAAGQNFKDGKAAMILDGSWFSGQVDGKSKVNQNNVKMMPFPAIPESLGGQNTRYMQSGFTSGFYISRKAWNNPEKRDLCVKLVEKMTSTAAIARFCKDAGGVPADNSVVLEDLTPLAQSMNTMPARTVASTLPLADAAKAGSFANLTAAAASYFQGDVDAITKALIKFAEAQK